MVYYDFCVMYAASYITSGTFYDMFEYFYLLYKNGVNTCYLLLIDKDKKDVMRAIKDKYRIYHSWGDVEKHMYILDRMHYTYTKKIVPIKSDVMLVPGITGMACVINSTILLPFKKALIMYEAPMSHPSVHKAFSRQLYTDKITFLYDDRIENPLPGYKSIPYRKKLFMDIFKPIGISKRACLLNLSTDHKCYDFDVIKNIITQYSEYFKSWFIYTKDEDGNDKNYEYYKPLRSNNVRVELAPVNNFFEQFDSYLYLPSLRGFDPSPRLIPECIHYDKQLIYHNFKNSLNDGGYFRYLDSLHDWGSLILTGDDEIFKIVEKV